MFVQHRQFPRNYHIDHESRRIELETTLAKYYRLSSSDDLDTAEQSFVTGEYNNVQREIATGSDRIAAWKAYVDQLEKDFPQYEIKNQTAMQPGIGAIIKLEHKRYGELIAKKSLYLYQSLLGPYFTIFGLDEVYYDNNRYIPLRFDPIVTVSPVEEYEETFLQIQAHIQALLPNILFLPFMLARSHYPGLHTPWSQQNQDNSLLEALFVNIDFGQYSFRGDLSYGLNEWSDTPLENNGWTAPPPENYPSS